MLAEKQPTAAGGDQPNDRPATQQNRIDSAALFGDTRLVQIEHAGATYFLRKTRQDKLILTK
jgi:hemin uptake protein HemP